MLSKGRVKNKPAANSTYKKLAVQQFLVALCFLSSSVVADSFVLRNRQLLVAAKRYYFPSAVIKGMLAAIGIIIFLKQIPHAFGYDKDYVGDLNFFQPDVVEIIENFIQSEKHLKDNVGVIGLEHLLDAQALEKVAVPASRLD